MTFSTLTVEAADDVAVICLNDPQTLNAITPVMIEELDAALDHCSRNARAIVLASAGRAFSSGANLTAEELGGARDALADAGLGLETHVNPLIAKLKSLPVPWIAAVRGAAAGVGCSIALAADMIVASESAYFLQAFSRIGLVPDGGAAWLLTRALGRARAMELMLLGEPLPAQAALSWGLVNRVVADDELDAAAKELAAHLARGPTRSYGLIRTLSWTAAEESLEATLAAERAAQRVAGRTADAAEGIAAFMEKRAPHFTGA